MNIPDSTNSNAYDGAIAVGYFDTLQLTQLRQNFLTLYSSMAILILNTLVLSSQI